jgi:8-amino-7-oxononanoate synthase
MLIGLFQQSLALKNFKLLPSETAIQPIIIGSNHDAMAVADALMARGFWVPAIRPPTVAEGTARLRVSLNAAHSVDDVMDLIMALVDIDAEFEG